MTATATSTNECIREVEGSDDYVYFDCVVRHHPASEESEFTKTVEHWIATCGDYSASSNHSPRWTMNDLKKIICQALDKSSYQVSLGRATYVGNHCTLFIEDMMVEDHTTALFKNNQMIETAAYRIVTDNIKAKLKEHGVESNHYWNIRDNATRICVDADKIRRHQLGSRYRTDTIIRARSFKKSARNGEFNWSKIAEAILDVHNSIMKRRRKEVAQETSRSDLNAGLEKMGKPSYCRHIKVDEFSNINITISTKDLAKVQEIANVLQTIGIDIFTD